MTNHPHRSKSSTVPAHTPTPWHVNDADESHVIIQDDKGEYVAHVADPYFSVASGKCAKRAAHIVRCVNAHDALVAALKRLVENVEAADDPLSLMHYLAVVAPDTEVWVQARAALAQAEGVANG